MRIEITDFHYIGVRALLECFSSSTDWYVEATADRVWVVR